MFKRELKFNLKSFLIWLVILIIMFMVVFLIYPSIMNSDNIKSIDEMMNSFSDEMLKAFNMDISNVSTAYGWFKTEGFIMMILVLGCYSGILGSNILLKEENDKTIEYLNSLPIKRRKIVLDKALCGFIYIFLITFLLGIFNYIGLEISGDLNLKQYILLSITPLLSSSVIFSICLFISTFVHKSKKVIGISLGIVFISYILNTLSGITKSVEFLKYFSVFTLADIRNVIINISIDPKMIIISSSLTIFFTLLTIIKYEKKELI